MPADSPELVVLLDQAGQPCGTADKSSVHGAVTPYHLAFSCYAFDEDDRLLVTRRAWSKRTFPGAWTNSCCGHPAPGEPPDGAVRRRLRDELGLEPVVLTVALPAFSYRASADGVEENELCPVYLARVIGEPRPNPHEVAECVWSTFEEFAGRTDISPWAALQVAALGEHVAGFLHRS